MRTIKTDEYYNFNVKIAFLNTISADLQKQFERYFERSKLLEEKLGRDLYDFTLDEISSLIYSLNPTTLNSAQTIKSNLGSYISWAIENGLVNNNLNIIKKMDIKWLKQFTEDVNLMLFSEKQINEITDKLVNYQDKVVVQLVFEGVLGHEASEILNLSRKSVDWNSGRLKLKCDKNGYRDVYVSDRCLHFIEKALLEKEYVKGNGMTDARNPILPLMNEDYVVRRVGTNVKTKPADKNMIYRKFSMIRKYLGDMVDFDITYFKVKEVYDSGLLRVAKDVYMENNKKFTGKELRESLSRFGYPITKGMSYTRISYKINEKTIQEFYPETQI